jgi:hypothetical protein
MIEVDKRVEFDKRVMTLCEAAGVKCYSCVLWSCYHSWQGSLTYKAYKAVRLCANREGLGLW